MNCGSDFVSYHLIVVHVDPATQMVRNLRAKEKAHEGAITALGAASGRVWTAGGSSAFVCMREWTQRGEFLKKHDLKSVGTVVSILFVSPIVRVASSSSQVGAASASFSTSPTSAGSSVLHSSIELPQAWQMLTGHANGIVQVWGDARGYLCPFLRIGGEVSPLTSIAVSPPLGLICSSHLGMFSSLLFVKTPSIVELINRYYTPQ